jgi:2-keto-4-pentenoate hydratase/2-oxohepta-3-ene-1,7-dioic acid hydratase in catechol pathway
VRLLSYVHGGSDEPRLGVRVSGHVLDVAKAAPLLDSSLPSTLKGALNQSALLGVDLVRRAAEAEPERFRHALVAEGEIRYLPLIWDAEKFLCVGKNYRSHLEELRRTDLIREMPQEVTGFIKLNSALTGHDGAVARPRTVSRLDYEPELVFVVGRECLAPIGDEDPLTYIAGVTVLNDLTDRDTQKREVASGTRFWTAKNAPGFGPLGPELITLDEIPDPYDLWMTCHVNGQQRMRVNTRDQIWTIGDILNHFARLIPIRPGDMFSTGAPGGVAVGKSNAEDLYLKPGDVVECGIEGFATLRNRIV